MEIKTNKILYDFLVKNSRITDNGKEYYKENGPPDFEGHFWQNTVLEVLLGKGYIGNRAIVDDVLTLSILKEEKVVYEHTQYNIKEYLGSGKTVPLGDILADFIQCIDG